MKITLGSYDREYNVDFELALDLLLIKNGIDYSIRSTTMTDAVIYNIPDELWNLTTFQHEYLKISLKYK